MSDSSHEKGLFELICKRQQQKYIMQEAKKNIKSTFTLPYKIRGVKYLNKFDLRKDKIRDLFVIACNTGVRYSDFGQFIPEYCQTIKMDNGETKEGFQIDTNKTGERVFIPMNTMVEHIWEKYDHKLPQVPSNQKMNEALKEIAEDAGLTQEEKKSTFRNKRADK